MNNAGHHPMTTDSYTLDSLALALQSIRTRLLRLEANMALMCPSAKLEPPITKTHISPQAQTLVEAVEGFLDGCDMVEEVVVLKSLRLALSREKKRSELVDKVIAQTRCFVNFGGVHCGLAGVKIAIKNLDTFDKGGGKREEGDNEMNPFDEAARKAASYIVQYYLATKPSDLDIAVEIEDVVTDINTCHAQLRSTYEKLCELVTLDKYSASQIDRWRELHADPLVQKAIEGSKE